MAARFDAQLRQDGAQEPEETTPKKLAHLQVDDAPEATFTKGELSTVERPLQV